MKKILVATSLFLASGVLAEQAPIKIDIKVNQLTGAFSFLDLTITALDDITINSITLNRGKCRVAHPNFSYKFPQKMEFSSSASYMTTCRDILEAKIDVDGAEWTFSQN